MTISSTTSRSTYNGDGSTTEFATGFKFDQNSHVRVVLRDTDGIEATWTEGTQYTLTGAGEADGGTVTVDTSPTDYTPQTGEKIAVIRVAPNTQESALPLGGAFPSTTVEKALDLAAMRDQQLAEKLNRALFFPETDPVGIGAGLPNDTERAGKFLAFSNTGAPVATAGTADATPHNTYMIELHGAANATQARTTLDAEKDFSSMTDDEVTAARTALDAEKDFSSKTDDELISIVTALAGVTPTFRVHRNGTDQTGVASATYTKIQFTNEDFDVGGYFDNATNYRFTPLVPGKYRFEFTVRLSVSVDQQALIAAIYKNGTSFAEHVARASGTNLLSSTVTTIIDLDGVDDFIEFYVYQDSGVAKVLAGSSVATYASGQYIGG